MLFSGISMQSKIEDFTDYLDSSEGMLRRSPLDLWHFQKHAGMTNSPKRLMQNKQMSKILDFK